MKNSNGVRGNIQIITLDSINVEEEKVDFMKIDV